MSLIINNLVWAKLEEVENIFWSKDFDLMEKSKTEFLICFEKMKFQEIFQIV